MCRLNLNVRVRKNLCNFYKFSANWSILRFASLHFLYGFQSDFYFKVWSSRAVLRGTTWFSPLKYINFLLSLSSLNIELFVRIQKVRVRFSHDLTSALGSLPIFSYILGCLWVFNKRWFMLCSTQDFVVFCLTLACLDFAMKIWQFQADRIWESVFIFTILVSL